MKYVSNYYKTIQRVRPVKYSPSLNTHLDIRLQFGLDLGRSSPFYEEIPKIELSYIDYTSSEIHSFNQEINL